jgi:sphinganine-1-phosphate aldolase
MMRKLAGKGLSFEEIRNSFLVMKENDVNWKSGLMSYYTHYANEDVLKAAGIGYELFQGENSAAREAFPSSVHIERDIVEMMLGLMNCGRNGMGYLTSGGTESILSAVLCARETALAGRRPHSGNLKIVVPSSAHPAYDKAAGYFGLDLVRTPLGVDFRAGAGEIAPFVDSSTAMIVASAPSFPYGAVDRINEISELALSRGIWLHVDACIGGFQIPFLPKPVSAELQFDFSFSGVTSISTDIHKYGFAPKGISAILYRDKRLCESHRFKSVDWPIGAGYATNGILGTRPATQAAAAWAVMNFLGEGGYRAITEKVIGIRERLSRGLEERGMAIVGKPLLGIFAYHAGDQEATHLLAEHLRSCGWRFSMLTNPKAIHHMLTPAQESSIDRYLQDVSDGLEKAARAPHSGDSDEKK